MKKWLTILGIIAAVVAIVLVAPLTFAKAPNNNATPTPGQQQPFWGDSYGGRDRHDRQPPPDGMPGMPHMHMPFQEVADVLGMTTDELQTAISEGNTIADIATEHNVALDKVIDVMIAPRIEKLTTLVKDGYLTQEEADSHIAIMRASMERRINQDMSQMAPPRPERGMPGMPNVSDDMATALSMTSDELITALRSGKTMADIATEQGVALDTLVDIMIQPMVERINSKVADGTITQAQADERIAQVRQNITDRMNQAGGAPTDHMRHPRPNGQFNRDGSCGTPATP